jgi:RND family efflux transporter MFP subunit
MSSAEVKLRAARSERARLEGLLADGVVPERRVVEARFAEEQAQGALNAARRRMGQAKGASGNKTRRGQGSIELRAPLSGVVVSVDVPPGLYVQAGHPLLRIVAADPLWLEVAIPEVHVALLKDATGVWFEVDGIDEPFEVTDTRLSIGGVVDTETRTLPLIVEVPNPDGRLRPGMFANVHVISGEMDETLAVPRAAIVREDGLNVAFVATDGETFERRSVRLGARDGALVRVESGLREGEWVVTDGAFAVRLAGLGDQPAGHGHTH